MGEHVRFSIDNTHDFCDTQDMDKKLRFTEIDQRDCPRCGGEGKIWFSTVDGGTCFKCNGRKKLDTPRGAAARAFYTARLSIPVEQVKPGILVKVEIVSLGWSFRGFREVLRVEKGDQFKIVTKGHRDLAEHEFFVNAGELVRRAATAEEKAEALKETLAFQNTLLFSGKPGTPEEIEAEDNRELAKEEKKAKDLADQIRKNEEWVEAARVRVIEWNRVTLAEYEQKILAAIPFCNKDEVQALTSFIDLLKAEVRSSVCYPAHEATGYLDQVKGVLAKVEARKQKGVGIQFLGTPGEKREFSGVVELFHFFRTKFGEQVICLVKTDDGGMVKLSKGLSPKGARVKFSATIKEHAEFRGVKQTVCLRPKLLETSDEVCRQYIA